MLEYLTQDFGSSLQTWLLFAQQDAGESVPFFQSGYFMLATIIGLLVLAWLLGHGIAKSIRLPEYGTRLTIIFGSLLIATLIIAAKWPPHFGIDLRGGMNLIGELNTEELDAGDGAMGPAQRTTAKDIIPNLIRRVDPSGTREIMIRALGPDKIEVTIPTDSEAVADEIWERLAKTGHLEFRIITESFHPEHSEIRKRAIEMARAGNTSSLVKDDDGKIIGRWVKLARVDSTGDDPNAILAFKFRPQPTHLLRDSATGQIVPVEQIPFGDNEEMWGYNFAKWWKEHYTGSPQILVAEPDESMNVEGKHLTRVSAGLDERGRMSVNFDLTAEGGQRMGEFTFMHKPNPSGEYMMAIVLDGQLHSAATIQEPIYHRGRITGNFTQKEVDDLIINLRSGKLDVALNENPISKQFIESALGQELKEKGIYAIGLSLVIVIVFMIFYYRFAGLVATFALLANLVLTIGFIMAIQQPLTLTGLAGLVLTVGMSVDANVLIFERIREELDRGAALRMAIRNGFDKATVTIIDANVTTLITAIVLYVIGTEQIKGFSVTLILGILFSMFTAIYCSRAFFEIAERKRWITKLNMVRLIGETNIDFIGKRFVAGLCSVLLIGAGLAATFSLGERILNHDLRGGTTVRMVTRAPIDADEVRRRLNEEKIKVNGEEVEFTVAKLQYDGELKDRVFKVDSSIPTWDGEGEAPYEELTDVLQRVFKDELELYHVDIQSVEVEPEGQGQETGALDIKSNRMFSHTAQLAAMLMQNPTLLLQDTGAEPAAPGNQTDDANQNDAGDSAQGEDNASEQTPPNNPQDNSLPQDDNAEGTQPIQQVNVVTKIQLNHALSGKELRILLTEAASRLGFELEDEQIQLSTPDAKPDVSPEKTMSKNWTIKIRANSKAQVEDLMNYWAENFNKQPYFPTVSGVGGQIARDTQLQALVAIIASFIGIIAYVWIRFQNVAFGLAGVVALVHDVLVVVGAIALSHYVSDFLGFLLIENFRISLPIVAALLTVIGYSLNDTIVVFDRIREVRGKRPEITAEIVNTSICQTLSRTLLTSLTTFLVVFILYVLGGDAIHGFAFALLIGVIVGTYSSIFVASPVLLWLMNRVGLNPGQPEPEQAVASA